MLDNGHPLTSMVDGAVDDGVYPLKPDERSDDKRVTSGLAKHLSKPSFARFQEQDIRFSSVLALPAFGSKISGSRLPETSSCVDKFTRCSASR